MLTISLAFRDPTEIPLRATLSAWSDNFASTKLKFLFLLLIVLGPISRTGLFYYPKIDGC